MKMFGFKGKDSKYKNVLVAYIALSRWLNLELTESRFNLYSKLHKLVQY